MCRMILDLELEIELEFSGEWGVEEEGGGFGQDQPNLESLLRRGIFDSSGKLGILSHFVCSFCPDQICDQTHLQEHLIHSICVYCTVHSC